MSKMVVTWNEDLLEEKDLKRRIKSIDSLIEALAKMKPKTKREQKKRSIVMVKAHTYKGLFEGMLEAQEGKNETE